MAFTGLDAFDRTIQKTNIWLDEVAQRIEVQGRDERQAAYVALRSTLQALRDRLVPEEAAHLGAQLPMLVRGFYYEGWSPARSPDKRLKSKEQLVERVWDAFNRDPKIDPDKVVRGTLETLANRISAGEIEDIRDMLPKDLDDLWPDRARRQGDSGREPDR